MRTDAPTHVSIATPFFVAMTSVFRSETLSPPRLSLPQVGHGSDLSGTAGMSDDLGDHPGTPAHRALSEVGESLVRVRVKDPKAHRLNLETPLYSIRIPDSKEDLDCGLCDRRFTAVGPTGHLEDEPICDLCMLEHHVQLGMVLALIAVTRSYGSGWPQDELEESHARLELMAFARIYESKASHFAPARPVDPNWLWPDGVDLDPNIS